MADNISIERKDGVGGTYTERYLGLWSGVTWANPMGNLSNKSIVYYRCRRIIGGVPSDYSNVVEVNYSAISPFPGGRL